MQRIQKNTGDKKQEMYRTIIGFFGAKNQVTKAIEEMSELQKELCKDLIGKGDIERIEEEIADVEIMIAQLKRIYLIDEDMIQSIKDKKLEQTMEIIHHGTLS